MWISTKKGGSLEPPLSGPEDRVLDASLEIPGKGTPDAAVGSGKHGDDFLPLIVQQSLASDHKCQIVGNLVADGQIEHCYRINACRGRLSRQGDGTRVAVITCLLYTSPSPRD